MKKSETTLTVILALCFLSSLHAVAQGYVIGWGYNPLYGCENSPFSQSSTGVVTVSEQMLSNVVAISAISGNRLALLNDGTVFGWGSESGGCGLIKINGNILSNIRGVSGEGPYAIRNDGTVVGWGQSGIEYSSVITGLSNVVAINGSLALMRNGTLVIWGEDSHETSAIPEGLSNLVAIARTGWAPSNLALKKDGTVALWHGRGREDEGPHGLSNIVAIARGEDFNGSTHYLALKKDRTVFGWGANGSEGIATGVPTTNRIASGLVTFGGHILTNVIAVAAGTSFSIALKSDGTVVAWGRNWFHQTDVPAGLSNVVAIAAGENFCLAITTNRAVAEKFRH